MKPVAKPTNPKDAIGQTKVPMDLVPETAVAEMATAFLEGALKYGRFNWRVMGVRASIYYSAMRRHMAKWYNGQDEDEMTQVSHLASVMACCAIIIDAKIRGKLNDDRPPSSPVAEHIDALAAKVAHLQKLFKDHDPKQYTIADTEVDYDDPNDDYDEEGGQKGRAPEDWEDEPAVVMDPLALPPSELKFVIKDCEPVPSFKELQEKLWAKHIADALKDFVENLDGEANVTK